MATAKNTAAASRTADEVAALEAFFERAKIAQAPAWRPAVDDVLSGTILGFRMGSTDEYGEYPIIVVQSAEGPVSFHCFHGVVRERLAEVQPKKGDMFTVQYGGTKVVNGEEHKPEAEQKRYHKYYIECGSTEAAPVLDEMKF